MIKNRNDKEQRDSSGYDVARVLNRHGVGTLLRQVFAGLMVLESDGHTLRHTSDSDHLHRMNY